MKDVTLNLQDEQAVIEQLKTWRRNLHQIPELELDLPMTAAYLKEQLQDLNCTILDLPDSGSSFAAFFDFGKEQCVAFRTDMDALPVQETCTHSFVSRHPGKMHACGHDGHMANLLLLAHRIHALQDNPNNVLLIFQAGEETPGGAELICKTGLLQDKNVQAIFGLHLWPALPKGTIATRGNEMMARASEIDILLEGKSAHAAKYQEGIDAMEAAAELLQDMYQMEAEMDPSIYRLLRFGHMEAGSVRNAVAAHARLSGSMRSFSDEVFDAMAEKIEQLAQKQEQKRKVKTEIRYLNGYPAVINDIPLTRQVLRLFPHVIELEKPEMIAEDFAFYLQEVPGTFFFLGTGTGIPLHASSFDFDEALLMEGASFFEALAKVPWTPKNGCVDML